MLHNDVKAQLIPETFSSKRVRMTKCVIHRLNRIKKYCSLK